MGAFFYFIKSQMKKYTQKISGKFQVVNGNNGFFGLFLTIKNTK